MKIKDIKAEEILDSRGRPTIKATVFTDFGEGSFAVPSGESKGKFAAHELRDGNPKYFNGNGVNKAIENIKNEIAPALLGMSVDRQQDIDKKMVELDGTPNKSRLGANAIIGVSVAVACAAAFSLKKEVYEYLPSLLNIKPSRKTPFLFLNLINGGKHASSKLAFQEYIIVPQTEDIKEAIKIGQDIFRVIKEDFGERYGDEGGYIMDTEDVIEPLRVLKKAAQKTLNLEKIKLALDVAASSFYEDGKYIIKNKEYSAPKLGELYSSIVPNFPFISIEDPFYEDDFESFAKLSKNLKELLVVGDDLTVTNKERLKKSIDVDAVRGVIIKPNQIGTLTETLETMKLARDNNIECIISHRSGETEDSFIADLAYAFRVFGLKAGAAWPKERMVKYNRLLNIVKKEKI